MTGIRREPEYRCSKPSSCEQRWQGIAENEALDPSSAMAALPDKASDRNVPAGGSGTMLSRAEDSWGGRAGGVTPQVLFRVSVRIDGPRGTQAFLQASMTPQ
jgi:hypothetical protein